MPTIQLQAQVSAEELLRAVGQLESVDLDEFVARVLALRASRQAPSLSHEETALFRRINEGMPEPAHSRYQELIGRRKAELLTAEEQDELLRLTDQAELLEARRAQALLELANLRGKPVAALLQDLGIVAPSDG